MPLNPSPDANRECSADSTPVGCWFVPTVFVLLVAVGWGWWNSQPPIITSAWANYETLFHDNLANHVNKGLHLDFTDDAWTEK